jgi:hypothetical protein
MDAIDIINQSLSYVWVIIFTGILALLVYWFFRK